MDFEIITPSRGLDFERCQLLCQTIDRFVGGSFRHIVVVDRSDYQLFVDSLQKDQVAIGIQSISQTPVEILRDYLAEST